MRLAEGLARRGIQVSVLTLKHNPTETEFETSSTGVKIYHQLKPTKLGPLWGITYRWQVAANLRELRDSWDVVFCSQLYLHSDIAAKVAAELGKHSASLIVNSSAFGDFPKLLKERNGARILQTTAKHSALFVMTRQSAQEALQHGFRAEQLRAFRYMVPKLPAVQTTPSASTELLYMGRLTPQKNVLGLIRAFGNYAETNSKLRLVIVGDGVEKSEVLEAIRTSPAVHRITRYGWTDAPDSFYARARAVLMFSRSEGLSNVMLEGLSHGKPLVITDVSGAREALDPQGQLPTPLQQGHSTQGVGGLLVPIEDEAAFADALKKLEDDSLVDALGKEAQQRVVDDFLEARCVDLFLEEINAVCANSTERSAHVRFPQS